MHTMMSDRLRRWLERQSSKREVVGSSSTMGKNFHFKFSLSSRDSQLDSANLNEINREIHLANAILQLGNCMHLLVQFSFTSDHFAGSPLPA